MPVEPLSTSSHLFTVRLWPKDLGEGQVEWRGKVQHVLSGEAHYFREWQELNTQLLGMGTRAGRTASVEPDV